MYKRVSTEKLNCISVARSSMIKGSVQKINIVLKVIRGKSILEAISLLSSVRKHVALDIRKVLLSALNNAEQKGFLNIDSLVVKNISAGKAVMLKRFQPRARGRIYGVTKHYSKIYVELHQIEEN